MTDAKLFRTAGSVLVADVDLIDGYSSRFDGRTVRQPIATEPGGEAITPRRGANERGALRLIFHATVDGASPAARAQAAYASLRLGVVHNFSHVFADVPGLVALTFTADTALLEQQEDRKRWVLTIDWVRVS